MWMTLKNVSLLQPFYAPDGVAGSAGGSDTGSEDGQSSSADDSGDAGDLGDDGGDAGDDSGDHAGDDDAGDREESLEDLLVDGDDDEHADDQRTADQRIKALSKKNRKLRRQMAKYLPALKRLGTVDLDDVLDRARRYNDFEEAARRNPKLRALVRGGDDVDDDADDDTPRRGRKTDAAPEFDESKLPFDPNKDAVHRYFADVAKGNHELRHQITQLMKRLDGFETRDQQRGEASAKSQWTSAIKAAGEKITDKKIAKLVRDAMIGAFNTPGVRGRYSADQVLNHYLKEYGADPAQARRVKDAAKQRIAERNKHLPRHASTGGMAAGARDGKREKLSDVRKRLSRAVS